MRFCPLQEQYLKKSLKCHTNLRYMAGGNVCSMGPPDSFLMSSTFQLLQGELSVRGQVAGSDTCSLFNL